MSEVLRFLDCGCAIMQDGRREWCPTCAGGYEKPRPTRRADAERLRDLVRELVEALDQLWASVGDRLLAHGPLSREYAAAVCEQIDAAKARAGAVLAGQPVKPPPLGDVVGELQAMNDLIQGGKP